MRRIWLALALLVLVTPAWAVRQGRFDRYIIGVNGQPVSGATVEIRRQGAWSAQVGTQAGDTGDGADTIQVVHKGAIETGDTVVIDTGSVGYTVGVVTDTTIQLTAGGVFSIPQNTRLSPTNNKPTLYIDNQGVTTETNPFTTSVIGQADCWLADGFYDYKVSGAGVTTRLIYDVVVGGVQKNEANTWTAPQAFDAGFTLSSVTVAPGNLISVDGNDTNLTPDPTCANSGAAGMMTLIDTDESATDVWTVCNGTSTYFVLPNVGSDVAANNEVLTGTGAGTAAWQAFPAGTLNVNENDASPSVATVATIKLPNGSLVDEGAGVTRFQPGGLRPPYQSGRWYDCDTSCGSAGNSLVNTTATGDQIIYLPYFVGYRATFDRIGLAYDPNTAVSGNVKLGIYTMNTAGQPDARILQTAGIAITNGGDGKAEATISQQLDPGWYYLAMIPDAGITYKANLTADARGILGFTNQLDVGNSQLQVMFHQNGQTYAGGLPATASNLGLSSVPRAARIMLRAQ